MANDNEDLILDVGADTGKAKNSLQKFADSDVDEPLNKLTQKIGASLAAAFAADKLVSFFKDSIAEAVAAEVAIKSFNVALKNSGQFSEQASQSFQDFAFSLQKLTGVQDDVILKNAGMLASVGKLSGQALRDATKAALDLAEGMPIDVGTAFDIVTKAANGHARSLKAYGIDVKEAQTNAEVFGDTLAFINKNFGGSAQSAIEGYSGKIKQLSNDWNDLKENVGNVIIKNTVLTDALSGSVMLLDYIAKAILTVFTAFFGSISVFATYAASLFKDPLNGMTVYKEKAGELEEQLKAIWAQTNNVNTANVALTDGLDKLNVKTDEAKAKEAERAAALAKSNDEFYSLASIAIQKYADAENTFENFRAGFTDGIKSMVISAKELGKAVSITFANGLSNAFAKVGQALVKGQNAFGEFGKAILTMLGQVAMQMGMFYLMAGLAAIWLNPAQGAGMIAGGLALFVVGGVLTALGGGGGEGGSASAASASSATSTNSYAYNSPDMAKEEERAKAQTGVQVIVQGNILDRRETGLELVKIINESFDVNGTVIRGFA